jgi:hypothetical protein
LLGVVKLSGHQGSDFVAPGGTGQLFFNKKWPDILRRENCGFPY